MKKSRQNLIDIWPAEGHVKMFVTLESKDGDRQMLFNGYSDSDEGIIFIAEHQFNKAMQFVQAGSRVMYVYFDDRSMLPSPEAVLSANQMSLF